MSTPDVNVQDSIWAPIRLESGTFSHRNTQCQVEGISVNSVSSLNDLFEFPLENIIGVIYAIKYQKKHSPKTENVTEQVLNDVTFSPYRENGNRCVTSSFLDLLHNKDVHVAGLDQLPSSKTGKDPRTIPSPTLEELAEAEKSNNIFCFVTCVFKNGKLYELDGMEKKPWLVEEVSNDENEESGWIRSLVEYLRNKINSDDSVMYCAAIIKEPDYKLEIETILAEIKELEAELEPQLVHPSFKSVTSRELKPNDLTSEGRKILEEKLKLEAKVGEYQEKLQSKKKKDIKKETKTNKSEDLGEGSSKCSLEGSSYTPVSRRTRSHSRVALEQIPSIESNIRSTLNRIPDNTLSTTDPRSVQSSESISADVSTEPKEVATEESPTSSNIENSEGQITENQSTPIKLEAEGGSDHGSEDSISIKQENVSGSDQGSEGSKSIKQEMISGSDQGSHQGSHQGIEETSTLIPLEQKSENAPSEPVDIEPRRSVESLSTELEKTGDVEEEDTNVVGFEVSSRSSTGDRYSECEPEDLNKEVVETEEVEVTESREVRETTVDENPEVINVETAKETDTETRSTVEEEQIMDEDEIRTSSKRKNEGEIDEDGSFKRLPVKKRYTKRQ